ncbi:MAG: serine hydrolase domain-containing protein [Mongoliitalea sp.]
MFCACAEEEKPTPPREMYFPPINSMQWDISTFNELGWNTQEFENFKTYLESMNTRAFIVLKDGRIAIEEYFGRTIIGNQPFGRTSQWYWASAGKTLTATLVGIAQQEGKLSIDDASSDYLGLSWTNLSPQKERLIQVKHQLSMTTGLDYLGVDLDCTLPSCLRYRTDAGQQWFYHNAPYTLLEKVVENATGINYNTYTRQKIGAKIGMGGQWISQEFNNVYWSTARDMARFGLLILNRGRWENNEVISDQNYFNQMVSSSQTLNPAYGYLWWLNGKESIIPPGISNSLNLPLASNAPADLIAGMGKNGQFVEVVPSMNLVVVRMGEAPDNALVPIAFHNEMWERLMRVIQ